MAGPDLAVDITAVDFSDPAQVAAYIGLLDAYARDPMGGGEALEATVQQRLPAALADHPTARCLLAWHDGRAIGLATCFLAFSTFRARPVLNIHDIAVAAQWRGRSVGRQLLRAITALAQRENCCRVTLEVREDNGAARALYAQNGFHSAACGLFLEMPLD